MVLGNLGLSQEVPADETLELTNGTVIRSVLELLEALKTMDKETYSHHVGEHYNDFAEWILDNYHNEELFLQVIETKKQTKLTKLLEQTLKKEIKQFNKDMKRTDARTKKKKDTKIVPPKRKRDVLKTLGGVE